jgi:hypothetical protein
MASKGKMVTGGVKTQQPGKKATTRVQSASEVRGVVARGNKRKLDVIPMEADLVENVTPAAGAPSSRATQASAAKDFQAMQAKEGDPFASKRGRQVDMSPYKPTKRDIDRGAAQDPNVFKGRDAPHPRATSKQLADVAAAQRRLDAVKLTRDTGGTVKKNVVTQEEKDRKQVGLISQYGGGTGLDSQRCATPGCNNNTSEITCTDCTAAGDPAGKKYTDAPSDRSIQFAAAGGQGSSSRNVELQNGLKQGRGAA